MERIESRILIWNNKYNRYVVVADNLHSGSMLQVQFPKAIERAKNDRNYDIEKVQIEQRTVTYSSRKLKE